MEGRAEASLQRAELALSQAWHTAAFMRMKKMPRRVPNIRTKRASPENPQSGADVLAVMRQLMARTSQSE